MFIIAIVLTAAAGVYCIIATRNMIRILIALELLIKSVTLLIAVAGVQCGQLALAESFIIALIVIEVVVTAIGAGITIAVHARCGSIDLRKLTNLKG